MYKRLLPRQMRQFESDGVCFPIRVLNPEDLRRYRSAFEAMENRLGKQLEYAGRTHLYLRWSYDLATHPVLLDAVEDILGPDLIVWGTLILAKQPKTTSYVDWHQDGYRERSIASGTLSAWIALSDSTVENGCMRVIPGSHIQPRRICQPDSSEQNMLVYAEKVIDYVDEARARNLVLQAGEMSLHSDTIIHGSGPNRSDTRRIGFIVRFATPQARSPRTLVVPCRGRQDYRHLPTLEQAPSEDLESSLVTYFAREGSLCR